MKIKTTTKETKMKDNFKRHVEQQTMELIDHSIDFEAMITMLDVMRGAIQTEIDEFGAEDCYDLDRLLKSIDGIDGAIANLKRAVIK